MRWANVLLVFTSTLFAMSLKAGVDLFIFYSVIAIMLSGQVVGQAKKVRQDREGLISLSPRRHGPRPGGRGGCGGGSR